MKLTAESPVVKMAYWNKWLDNEMWKVPKQTSLCRLFWRLIGATLGAIGTALLLLIGLVVIGIPLCVILFFFGYRFDLGNASNPNPVAPIKHWPRIFGARITPWIIVSFLPALLVGYRPLMFRGEEDLGFVEPARWWPTVSGFRVIPLYTALWVGGLYGAYRGLSWLGPAVYDDVQKEVSPVAWVLIGLVLIVLAVLGIRAFLRSEPGQLTKAFLKAKKERVCPIIQIEGLPEPPKPAEGAQ